MDKPFFVSIPIFSMTLFSLPNHDLTFHPILSANVPVRNGWESRTRFSEVSFLPGKPRSQLTFSRLFILGKGLAKPVLVETKVGIFIEAESYISGMIVRMFGGCGLF
jgi:hypothetical protein